MMCPSPHVPVRSQNGIGIVLAGGLGGYLYLKSQDAERAESAFECALRPISRSDIMWASVAHIHIIWAHHWRVLACKHVTFVKCARRESLGSERAAVESLRTEVARAQEAVRSEQLLAERLRKQADVASASAQRQACTSAVCRAPSRTPPQWPCHPKREGLNPAAATAKRGSSKLMTLSGQLCPVES